jgi:hypothetical protein
LSLQLIRDGFLDDVRRVLKEAGISPQLLELEVTESVLLDGTAPVVELMATLNYRHRSGRDYHGSPHGHDRGGGRDRNPGAAARPGPETLRYTTGVSVRTTDASGRFEATS